MVRKLFGSQNQLITLTDSSPAYTADIDQARVESGECVIDVMVYNNEAVSQTFKVEFFTTTVGMTSPVVNLTGTITIGAGSTKHINKLLHVDYYGEDKYNPLVDIVSVVVTKLTTGSNTKLEVYGAVSYR